VVLQSINYAIDSIIHTIAAFILQTILLPLLFWYFGLKGLKCIIAKADKIIEDKPEQSSS
jgi:hypothetical protein